ncbi:MAG: hypothetical protein ACOX2L_00700 [Anaerolineae bacterium]|jgi:peptidoglycan/xylan/chitin deacetylase (PgdA/CDA1 family)
MATILVGYDTERYEEPDVTRHFLDVMPRLHEELGIPCTLFLLGKVIELHEPRLAPLAGKPLFDLQQHGYAHRPFKTYVMDFRELSDQEFETSELFRGQPRIAMHRGISLDEVRDEVTKTKALLKERLGVENIGITCPFAYYQGLLDRPDLTDLLYDLGIRFVRSWGRNYWGWCPTPFSEQPFTYSLHGHDDMLEFPMQGWHDTLWKMQHGFGDIEGFVSMLKSTLEEVQEHDYVWCLLAHDWSSIKEDPEMRGMRMFFEHALRQGVTFELYADYYRRHVAAMTQ